MSNFKVGDVVIYIGEDPLFPKEPIRIKNIVECACGELAAQFGIALPSVYPHYYCSICLEDKFDGQYTKRFCVLRKIEPAKPKVNYRLANLEILTQFPVIKERSDQPLIKEQEVEHAQP